MVVGLQPGSVVEPSVESSSQLGPGLGLGSEPVHARTVREMSMGKGVCYHMAVAVVRDHAE